MKSKTFEVLAIVAATMFILLAVMPLHTGATAVGITFLLLAILNYQIVIHTRLSRVEEQKRNT